MPCRRSIPFLAILLAYVVAELAHATETAKQNRFSVRDQGAIGNGTTLDTAAIQRTIDACCAAGGGCVYFSPGVYLSGTIYLKDNVRLVLEANAVLRGSPNPKDYPPSPRKNVLGKPAFVNPPFSGGGFLLYADGVRNASIEGRGTIDGQGSEFWFKEMLSPMVRKPMPNRPRAMIGIIKGQNLLFRDVTFVNSPCYTLWLMGCDNVNVDGITIRNPRNGPNTDGIDVDCCRDVRIANCSIDGGDDAIAIKSDAGLLGEDKPCENVVVTNCTLASVPACGIRVGYEGDAVIRNCTFSNLAIYDTNIGLDMVCVRPGDTIAKGTRCENITFDNIVMRNVDKAIYFWMGHEPGGPSQVCMKNIQVSNLIAQARFGSYIGGFSEKHAENIGLSNIRMILVGSMPDGAPQSGCGVWGGQNPYALYCSHVDGLDIKDLSVDFREARGAWRHAVFCEQANGVRIRGVETRGFGGPVGQAAMGFVKSTAAIRDSDAEPGLPAFLNAASSSNLFCSGCDMRGAKRPFTADNSSTVRMAEPTQNGPSR